ncbi:uncharacterized protein LOC133156219 [Syngnathus typhle]|uniref:uncharacterized protein LOC133156219 n=1 Tax=Syngnathus typhle TaxID=161592 RepID=UPI002A6B46C4|nr:uncharacterized protein LOC133156219 [Syngnathus typhle]XP_061138030.1 uncharacterized protein LOC133156219 [Syngnathus typhle]
MEGEEAGRSEEHGKAIRINFVKLGEKKPGAKWHPGSSIAGLAEKGLAVATKNVAAPLLTNDGTVVIQSGVSDGIVTTVEAEGPLPDVARPTDPAFAELDWSPTEGRDNLRSVARRAAAWRAYGFEASALSGVDEWARKNMWYQLTAHSIKSSKTMSGPCLVLVKTPSTLQAVFQTVPVPVSDNCQLRLLLWLVYEQSWKAPETDAQVRKVFESTGECAWISERPYLDLLAVHDDIRVGVPESIEVPSVGVPTCFCSVSHGGPGVAMGVADCKAYFMQFPVQKGGERGAVLPVTFALPGTPRVVTVRMENRTVPGNATIGNLRDVCGSRAYLFLPYGWGGLLLSGDLETPFRGDAD